MTHNFWVFLLEHLKGEEVSKRSPQKKNKILKKTTTTQHVKKYFIAKKFKHVVDKEEV
jgi:hypothetical protein